MDTNAPYFSRHTGDEIDKSVQDARESIPAQLKQLFAGTNLHIHILEDDFSQLLSSGTVDLTRYYYCYSEEPMVPNSLTKIYFGDMLFARRGSSEGSDGFPYDFPIVF